MAYEKQTWNNADPATPLSAERMGHLEDGIFEAHEAIDGGGLGGTGLPAGGTAGQVLTKQSSTTGDAVWTTPTSGGTTNVTGGSGPGPNWIAANNAPTAIKNMVTAAGGQVCDGVDDQIQFATQLTAYAHVRFTEGTYNFSGTLTIPARRYLQGSGPGSIIAGAAGATGRLIYLTGDHPWLSDFRIDGGGEAAGTHHIEANITSNTGFTTGEDACPVIERIISRNAKGDGIRIDGTYARDGKINSCHVWNATGNGYFVGTADGTIVQCIAGTCGGNGFELASDSGNWRLTNCKAWYSDKDGFRVDGTRHTLVGIEAQDNAFSGIRIISDVTTLTGWIADSNSYEGTTYDNVYAGLEIGLTETGASNGGYDCSIGTGTSWDKNESARGFKQRSGVRLRSGIRGLTMVGVGTGNPASNFKNVTAGIEFNTPSDLNHANNYITGCLNHYARMQSA